MVRGRAQTTWPLGGRGGLGKIPRQTTRGEGGSLAENHVTFFPHLCIFIPYQTMELSFTARAKPSDYHTVGGGSRKGFDFLNKQLFFLRFYSNLNLSSRLKHESGRATLMIKIGYSNKSNYIIREFIHCFFLDCSFNRSP